MLPRDRGWLTASALGGLVLLLLCVWVAVRPSLDPADVIAVGAALLGAVGLLVGRVGGGPPGEAPPLG